MFIKIFDVNLQGEIYVNSDNIVGIYPNFEGSEITLSDGASLVSSLSQEQIYKLIIKELDNKR